jgi:peptidoglycan/xylan/chitin deacetylase (PgdA/CDA1 family)
MFISRPPLLLQSLLPGLLWRGDASEKKIYLTFDDGPIPGVTPWVLDFLAEEGIGATFFCVGDNVAKYPDVYASILAGGHATGNHTHNHLRGFKTTKKQYLSNVAQCAEVVHSGLFRPPHGRITPALAKVLRNNYRIVMWDVLTGDYDKQRTPQQCFETVKKHVRNGSVIVFHDSLKAEKNLKPALAQTVKYLKAEGYTFGVLQAF